jgi:hypothetical protein
MSLVFSLLLDIFLFSVHILDSNPSRWWFIGECPHPLLWCQPFQYASYLDQICCFWMREKRNSRRGGVWAANQGYWQSQMAANTRSMRPGNLPAAASSPPFREQYQRQRSVCVFIKRTKRSRTLKLPCRKHSLSHAPLPVMILALTGSTVH